MRFACAFAVHRALIRNVYIVNFFDCTTLRCSEMLTSMKAMTNEALQSVGNQRDAMTYNVSIQGSPHTFSAGGSESVLQAALKVGIVIPYGCRDGVCGSCKGKLVSGQIDYGHYVSTALKETEKQQGYALFCQARALSDLVIAPREVRVGSDIEARKLPTRVQKVQRVAPDVIVLELQPPASQSVKFYAGQYLDVLLRDGTRRSFSMGNAPHETGTLQLHVRLVPGGSFTEYVFNAMKEKEMLRIEAPLGTFFLREDSAKPIVFVASGTGFAPVKAIIQSALHKDIKRPMVLYWGGRRPHDLYMNELAVGWASANSHFQYVPVISNALPEDGWTGRSGLVHRAVMDDFPDLSGHQVYACGVPIMVDSARKDFTIRCRLPTAEFFCDSFVTAADLAK
jgi:CDP-4-dehydro-6-deoxyglucose reductase